MERLNALEWADGLCFTVWGVRVGIRVTVQETLPHLLPLLPPAWRPAGSRTVQLLYSLSSVPSRRTPGSLLHQLYQDGRLVARGSDFSRIRDGFGVDLRLVLSQTTPWRTFIHAGAVGWRGRAIVIPGASDSGKTTLTEALVRAGAALYSDEFAVLDRKGRVHPYPLPLRRREGEGPRSQKVPVETLGGEVGTGPLPVGLILATRFDPEARGGLRRISPGRAALALLTHANQARTRADRVLETVGKAAHGAFALQGPRGEVEEIMDRILGLW